MGGWRYYDGSVVADLGTATGTLAPANGGIGTDSSGATGLASVNAGAWTFDPAFKYVGTTTPILTIGNDTEEDIIFEWKGNAQDYHIALDDSADSLLLGLGTTVGTTPQITLTATAIVINEDSNDYDFRVEGNTNADMIVMNSTNSSMSFGGAFVDGAAFTLNNLSGRTFITKVGSQLHVPAQTVSFDNGAVTVAVGAAVFLGIPTLSNDTASLTLTEASTLYIDGPPVVGSQTVITKALSLHIAAGNVMIEGVGPHAFGGKGAAHKRMSFEGNFSGGGATWSAHVSVSGALTGSSGNTSFLASTILASSIATQSDTESIAVVAQLYIDEPFITDNLGGADVVTVATTVYIKAAPTEGTDNYALFVDGGACRFDGDIDLSAQGTAKIIIGTGALVWMEDTDAVERMRITDAGLLFVGDTSNGKMTVGMTINQGASDNEILALKSSDVTHTFTTQTEADTWVAFTKTGPTTGGVTMSGYTLGAFAIQFIGHVDATDLDDTDTTGSTAAILIDVYEDTGTTRQAVVAGNIFVVRNATTARAVLKESGELHLSVQTTAQLDDHDDYQLIVDAENYRTEGQLQSNYATMVADGAYGRLVEIGLLGEVGEEDWNSGVRPLMSVQRSVELLNGDAKQELEIVL